MDDKYDNCYAATLVEWETYRTLHKPQPAPQKPAFGGSEDYQKRKREGSEDGLSQLVPKTSNGAGFVSNPPSLFSLSPTPA